jgi:NADPH2:quinone reductase
MFAPGDEVCYAGSVGRPGSDAQFQLADERIAGHKPRTLSFAQAAALPLTSLTAWKTLFDRFRLDAATSGTPLVLAAAGGVGSHGHPAGPRTHPAHRDRHRLAA